jgi:hypothetical protein
MKLLLNLLLLLGLGLGLSLAAAQAQAQQQAKQGQQQALLLSLLGVLLRHNCSVRGIRVDATVNDGLPWSTLPLLRKRKTSLWILNSILLTAIWPATYLKKIFD